MRMMRIWTGQRPSGWSRALGPKGRDVLLRALTTTEEQRAELIGQLYQLSPVPEVAELLILLEEREWARQAMIGLLRDA
jgi:hypothetical protein